MFGVLMFLVLATDVAGQWRAIVSAESQRAEINLFLRQSGDSLTGTVQMQDMLGQIEKGAVHGDTVSFSAAFPMGGKLVDVPFEGRIEGEHIRLQFEGLDFVASRVPSKPDDERIQRLSGLFRLWGIVKFFHPYIARGAVDWDAALLRAIPKVESGQTGEGYRAAVQSMLGEIRDPDTQVLRGGEALPIEPAPHQRRVLRNGYYPQVGGTLGRGFYTSWEAVGPTPAFIAELPDGIRVAIRTAEAASSPAEFLSAEKIYGNSLPTKEQRLLALARFWNTVHYFYGFPENIPNWDHVLSEFIPQFESAATWRDYVFAIARLASQTNDSHTWIPEFWGQLGNAPAVAVWPIGGQSVVREVAEGVKGIERGDIIAAVDGQPVEQRRKFLLNMYPHSTVQGGLLMVNQFLLAGDGPTVKVGVIKADGKLVNLELARTTMLEFRRATPIYQVLPSGYGYIDLTRLPESEVDKAFDSIIDTPGLILDLRGYPDAGFSKYAPRFAQSPMDAALIRRRLWHGPDPALSSIQSAVDKVWPSDKPRYPRRVAVLIDATAVSRPEHVSLQLEAAANATFIGTPTRGAIGEVTNTVLPGGVQVNFTAEERRHANGRPVQGVGIVPQVWAAPTIRGLREGRDEILETAVEFLKLCDVVAKQ